MYRSFSLITALALLAASAHAATLLGQWDGFSSTGSGGIHADLGSGNLSITLNGATASEGQLRVTSGAAAATIDLGSLSLSPTATVTVVMQASNMPSATSGSQNIFTFSGSSNYYAGLANSGNDKWAILGSGTTKNEGTSASSTGTTGTIVYQMSGNTIKAYGFLDADGHLSNSGTLTQLAAWTGLSDETLQTMYLGAWKGQNANSSYTVERLGIYSGELPLSSSTSVGDLWQTPEPATASLSLLGAAALLFRRRRALP